MVEEFWTRALAFSLAVGASWALRAPGVRWARDPKRVARARVVAAARLSLMLLGGWLVLSQLVGSSRGLSPLLQWSLWVAGALLALPWFANAVAGLWLVSPFVGAGPGDTVVACGQPGRIAGYGIARLELQTETGWTAYLFYLTVALRPFLVSPQSRASLMELAFKKVHWTPEEIAFLRETAVLAPFRDLSVPVTISRHDDVVRVQLALVRPEAQERMRQCLESALNATRLHAEPAELDAVARR